MPRFRKRPIVIDAYQWNGGPTDELSRFCGANWARAEAKGLAWSGPEDGERVVIWAAPEHSWVCCPKGHWIIRGIDGENYPCDPSVFARTYEAV